MIGGHGHVTPRADGLVARCGGPAICAQCAQEACSVGFVGEETPATCPACGQSTGPVRVTEFGTAPADGGNDDVA